MSSHQEGVAVYSFRVYAGHVEIPRVAGYKATRQAIRELDGEAIAGTEELVAETELDEKGRYRRICTGWGELA